MSGQGASEHVSERTQVRERAPQPATRAGRQMRRLADGHDPPGPHHGDRAGTHRVPADLVVRAPDHRAVPVRLERPVHHLAGVQRDAPHRDAGRAARLLPGRLGPARPGRLRGHPRSLVPRRSGPDASRGCWSRRRSRRRSSASCSTTSSRPRSATSGWSPSRSSSAPSILWLADRWGGRTKGVDDVTFPIAVGDRRRPGAGAHPGHQPVRDLASRPRASPGWTARPRPASRS